MLYRLLGGEPAGIELEDSDFQETVTKRSFFANSAAAIVFEEKVFLP